MTPWPSEHDADAETRGCCRDAAAGPPGDDRLASDGGRTVETLRLSVPEMDCAACASTVENAVAAARRRRPYAHDAVQPRDCVLDRRCTGGTVHLRD